MKRLKLYKLILWLSSYIGLIYIEYKTIVEYYNLFYKEDKDIHIIVLTSLIILCIISTFNIIKYTKLYIKKIKNDYNTKKRKKEKWYNDKP
jgi:cell division protein FtsL